MPTDDQIRELCARALTTHGPEFEAAIRDLQSALRWRLEELSNLTLATLLKMPRVFSPGNVEEEAAATTAEEDEKKAG
jgi:hypothetical protein